MEIALQILSIIINIILLVIPSAILGYMIISDLKDDRELRKEILKDTKDKQEK